MFRDLLLRHSPGVFTVDQAYRINRNRLLLRQPVAAVAGSTPVPDEVGLETLEILCECSAQHCNESLVIERGAYKRLNPERMQLVVAIGHEMDSPVHVTSRTTTYEVLEPWRP